MNKALFLDRDGTIIFDKNYLADPMQVELIPGAVDALRLAAGLGYYLFLFTNQSGIGRKYFSLEDVAKVHDRMIDLIGLPRPLFVEICIAPETPDEPQNYRKPSPRFVLEMLRKHNLDPNQCYMVGDANSDIMAGINAGIKSIGLTGPRLKPDELPREVAGALPVFPNLLSFVEHLQAGRVRAFSDGL